MKTITLKEVAELIGAKLCGDEAATICGVAPIHSATEKQLTFLNDDKKYRSHLNETKAGAVIMNPSMAGQYQGNCLLAENPEFAFGRVAALFDRFEWPAFSIHPSAVIAEQTDIANDVFIGANCVIEKGVQIQSGTRILAGTVVGAGSKIGKDGLLHANVTIAHHVCLGDRVTIHSGAIIGSDGFGYSNQKGQWVKTPQIGGVVIHDDVEIGANTTIDRGAIDNTVIGKGVKIDNLVQIAHNVEIGDHTALAGCVGIAGSTKIGRYCLIGGAARINGHISIVDGTIVSGMAAISNHITEPGIYSSGTGFQKHAQWRKSVARYHQLNAIVRRIQKLEKMQHERID